MPPILQEFIPQSVDISLNELELIALKIAEEDLETSFNIRKSIE